MFQITALILYSFSLIIILLANSFIFRAAIRTVKSHSGYFFISLIVSRILIAFFVIPGHMTALFSEEFIGRKICKSCHYFAKLSTTSSFFSIVFIAISRCGKWNKSLINASLVLLWILSGLYAITGSFQFDLLPVEDKQVNATTVRKNCITNDNKYLYADLVILCIIPILMNIISSFVILKDRKRDRKSVMKIVYMTLILTILLIVCNQPMIISQLINFNSEGWILSFNLLSFSNSWINVIIFCYFKKELRPQIQNHKIISIHPLYFKEKSKQNLRKENEEN